MEQLIKAIGETLIKNEDRLEEVTFKENFIVIRFKPKTKPSITEEQLNDEARAKELSEWQDKEAGKAHPQYVR